MDGAADERLGVYSLHPCQRGAYLHVIHALMLTETNMRFAKPQPFGPTIDLRRAEKPARVGMPHADQLIEACAASCNLFLEDAHLR